jgi:hypothetical protein
MQCCIPIDRCFQRPTNTDSYTAILLLHLSALTANCSHAVYLSLIPEGECSIAAALAPEIPQASSQYTCHDMLATVSFVYFDSSI